MIPNTSTPGHYVIKTTALNAQILADGPVDTLPSEVELIPEGTVTGRDGRSWQNSDPMNVLAAFTAGDVDLPVDVEHATEIKAPKGEPAPAAGWVKELFYRAGAIWGRIEWNQTGRDLVASKQYRYLSPVILYDPKTSIIAGLTSVALTNRPNLALPALNHHQGSAPQPKEQSMIKLMAALGLPETATGDQALAAINTLKAQLATASNSLEVGIALDKFVPRADYDQALAKATNAEQRLSDISKQKLDDDIAAAIAAALASGKITPATVDYHKAQCSQDGGLQRFAAYCAAAPSIGEPSGLDDKKIDAQAKALNTMDKEVCDKLGLTEDEYRKAAL